MILYQRILLSTSLTKVRLGVYIHIYIYINLRVLWHFSCLFIWLMHYIRMNFNHWCPFPSRRLNEKCFNCICRWFNMETKNAGGICDCTCAWAFALSESPLPTSLCSPCTYNAWSGHLWFSSMLSIDSLLFYEQKDSKIWCDLIFIVSQDFNPVLFDFFMLTGGALGEKQHLLNQDVMLISDIPYLDSSFFKTGISIIVLMYFSI